MEIFTDPGSWVALLTLTFLEIILGVDNIIFISLVTQRLKIEEQRKARNIGLLLALVFRIMLLLSITWIIQLKEPLFSVFNLAFSGRDLILLGGGAFLIAKSTSEIHHKITAFSSEKTVKIKKNSFWSVIVQIILLDIIFSIDSILTAIGLSDQVLLMVIAVVIAMLVMMGFAGKISEVINKHPTLQILALAFLILIGFTLVLEVEALPFHIHVPKGYIYFAVFFSLLVELLNMALRKQKVNKV